MASDNKNMLLTWLRDAHAMESTAVSILEKQLDGVEDFPEMHAKVTEHLEVTKRQRSRVKGCIEQLGGDTSKLKEMVGKFSGIMQGLGATGAHDTAVKAAISDHAFEAMEIASYTSLVAAAEAYGEPEIRQVCEEILEEEKEMASWLENNIPEVTRMHLKKMGVNMKSTGQTSSKPGPERRSGPSRPRA